MYNTIKLQRWPQVQPMALAWWFGHHVLKNSKDPNFFIQESCQYNIYSRSNFESRQHQNSACKHQSCSNIKCIFIIQEHINDIIIMLYIIINMFYNQINNISSSIKQDLNITHNNTSKNHMKTCQEPFKNVNLC